MVTAEGIMDLEGPRGVVLPPAPSGPAERLFPCLRAAVVALLAFPLPAFSTPAAIQQDTATALIQGTLLDEQSGDPIRYGLVRLMGDDDRPIRAVETDTEGRFAFRVPVPGVYYLRVEGFGYEDKETGRFSPPPGYYLAIEVGLTPKPIPLDPVVVVRRRRPLRATEQLIQGTLRDFDTGEPIAQGAVSLLRAPRPGAVDVDLEREILSDDDGFFSFITPLPGVYRLRGERIGYRTTDSPELLMMPGDTIVLDLYMSVQAILLDPIRVVASARPLGDRYHLLGMDAFFHRQSRFGESGFGTFLSRDQIAGFDNRVTTGHMLLTAASVVRFLNRDGAPVLLHECNPSYYVNGAEVVRGDQVHSPMMGAEPATPLSQGLDLNLMYGPETLEAVEIYLSPSIPSEFSNGYPCGVIGLWTRR